MSGCISDVTCSRSLKVAYKYGNGHVASNMLRYEKHRRKSHAFWYSCWKTPYPNECGSTIKDMIFFWICFHLIKASLLEHQVSFLLKASRDIGFLVHHSLPIGVAGDAVFLFVFSQWQFWAPPSSISCGLSIWPWGPWKELLLLVILATACIRLIPMTATPNITQIAAGIVLQLRLLNLI